MTEKEKFLTTQEAADHFNVSTTTVLNWMKDKKVKKRKMKKPGSKTGNAYLVSEIEKFWTVVDYA